MLGKEDYLLAIKEPTSIDAARKLYPDAGEVLHRRKLHGKRILANRLRRELAAFRIPWPAHWKRGRPPARYNRAETMKEERKTKNAVIN
jgi:hypothetical protein